MVSFNSFLRKTYGTRESTNTVVLGEAETGKTDFNFFIMERVHDLELFSHFATNMETVEADFAIMKIQDFETLKKTCKMINSNPMKQGLKKILFFGSEIGKWAARDKAWMNTDLIQELQTQRKYGLNFLTDAIDRVDARVLSPRFFLGEFVKHNKKFATFENYRTHAVLPFHKIPKTRIKYNTYEEANFYMKPQNPNDVFIPLNKDHELLKRYREAGTCKKAGIHPQELKRARDHVIDFHLTHCLKEDHETDKEKPVSEDSINS